MHYYGTRLSENISRREPEGYLLCLNVPVARTGTQEYLPEELGLQGSGLIPVLRPEAEVFSPETIASFEGMPVTNDHPPEGVDTSNIRALQKGHAHNIRRGSGEESDLLMADLIITDPQLIDLILEEGKREISCGYTYELNEENGQYIQRKIRGNHVAVVDAGRAGRRVCIRDHDSASTKAPLEPSPRVSIKDHKPERRKNKMKKSLSKILARMAKDGDIETVAEIIEEMIEPEVAAEETAEAVAEVVEDPAAVVETPEGTTVVVDEVTLADIISRLDQIITLLTPAPAADEDPAEEIAEAVEEVVEAAEEEAGAAEPETVTEVAEILEEILEPETGEEPAETPSAEEDECGDPQPEVISTGDALRAALKAVRPALAKMPKKQRQRVCADIAAQLKKPAREGIYSAINDAARRRPEAGPDLGKRIMASRNPNYKK